MGNRAVITIAKYDTNGKVIEKVDDNEIGVYLHWNGGYDSVNAFLKYCKLCGHREPEQDNYGWARLCQVIGNYFGGTTSIGIDTCNHLDCNNWNNGVYLIHNWEIVGRVYHEGREQTNYDLREMLVEINNRQPESERCSEFEIDDFLKQEGLYFVEDKTDESVDD